MFSYTHAVNDALILTISSYIYVYINKPLTIKELLNDQLQIGYELFFFPFLKYTNTAAHKNHFNFASLTHHSKQQYLVWNPYCIRNLKTAPLKWFLSISCLTRSPDFCIS